MLMRPEEPRQPRLITWDEVDQLIDGLVPRIQAMGSLRRHGHDHAGRRVIPGGPAGGSAKHTASLDRNRVDFVATRAIGA